MLEKRISENNYELTIKSKGLDSSCIRTAAKDGSNFTAALQDAFDEQTKLKRLLSSGIFKRRILAVILSIAEIFSYLLIFGFFFGGIREAKKDVFFRIRAFKQLILENKIELTAEYPNESKLSYSNFVTAMAGLSKASRIRTQKHARLPKIYKSGMTDYFNFQGICVKIRSKEKGKILIFSFFILYVTKKRIQVFDIEKLSLICTRERIAQNSDIPPDALIVGKSYLHSKKDGGPDLRYKHNPYDNVVEYGQAEFNLKNASAAFYISNSRLLEPLEQSMHNWLITNSLTAAAPEPSAKKISASARIKAFTKTGDNFMNTEKQALLTQLHITRQNIKQEELEVYGRNVAVASDETLIAIAQFLPTTIDDLLAIPGIGKAAAEKWGEQFLVTVKEYLEQSGGVKNSMPDNILFTLRTLERKLIGLNRRNRLLYMPIIRERAAYDLTNAGDSASIIKLLFSEKNAKIKIDAAPEALEKNDAIIAVPDTVKIGDDGKKAKKKKCASGNEYARIMPLLREVNRIYRETGSYDLYAGYPYVEGRLATTEFDIKAPLALFPIKEERTVSGVSLSIDRSRSVLLNTNFIYAIAKTSGKIFDVKADTIEDFDENNFLPMLIDFYNNLGLNLKHEPSSRIIPYEDVKEDDFAKYKFGELKILHNCVLGRFSLTDTALQRDFAKILENGKINDNLEELISKAESGDWDSVESSDKDTEILPKESEIDYINSLNYSQEKVIASLKKKNKLVVFGPPGTGKSQTITSVIADVAGAGGNVLMISEKKAALDVIYSRLGELSDFALIIDDVEDKQAFYGQLGRMMDIDAGNCSKPVSKDMLIKGIDADLRTLDRIAESLYQKTPFGVEMYKLIKLEHKFDYSNPKDMAVIGRVKELLTEQQRALGYEELTALTDFFDDKDKEILIKDWIKTFDNEKWLKLLRTDLTQLDVAECTQLIARILDRFALMKISGFMTALKIKKEIQGLIEIQLAKYLIHTDKNIVRAAKTILPVMQSVLSRYNDFTQALNLIDGFTPAQNAYCRMLLRFSFESGIDMTECARLVFRYLVSVKIEEWEIQNKDLFKNLSDYRDIIDNLSKRIDNKTNVTKNELYYKLAHTFELVTRSKRYGDMKRLAESSRKIGLAKYISRFDNELFLGVRIWLATPEAVSRILPLTDGLFDLVVFDEASQIYIERSIPGLVRGKKLLIAGDSKQLRPSSLGFGRFGEVDEEILEEKGLQVTALEVESLLDLAEAKYSRVMLNCHYRSKYEELIAFSNSAFYKNKLMVSPNTQANAKPIEVVKVEGGKWINRANAEEAKRIVALVKDILKNRKNNESIGIITFNANQRDKIEILLDNEATIDREFGVAYRDEISRKHNGEDIGLFVKNIENVQGDERDIVIFSVGYAPGENGKILRQFGWLSFQNGENRLNVAITRAKSKVYLVTSITPDQFIVDDLAGHGPKLLKSYMEYAYALSDGDTERAKKVLNGLFLQTSKMQKVSQKERYIEELKQELIKQGQIVDSNVGIGGYNIDLALKDKNGNYILGIEYDEKIYASSQTARERDYHRQKYLTGRGWKIYRLFGVNFKRSRESEAAKIIAAACAKEQESLQGKDFKYSGI